MAIFTLYPFRELKLPTITGILELAVPLQGNVSNAVVNFNEHNVSLVAVVSDVIRHGKPVIGFGFNSIGRFAQSGIIQDRIVPRVTAAEPGTLLSPDGTDFDPVAVRNIALKNEKPGGHGDRAGAIAALELAIWDLNSKLADVPAWAFIASATGREVQNPQVNTYAAGGYYYADDSINRLVTELNGYRTMGFNAIKIKIGGVALTEDLDRIDAAIETTGDPARVAVDANGRFNKDVAEKYLNELSPRNLRWYEEPGDPLDFSLMQSLARKSDLPLATGENLFSVQDTNNLLRYGGLRPGHDIFQMDAGLSYGLCEYLDMLKILESAGHSRTRCFPHGGHLINLHIVAALGLGGCEAYPGVFQPFGGFAPTCELNEGTITPSEAPGFGLEEKPELRPYLKKLVEGV